MKINGFVLVLWIHGPLHETRITVLAIAAQESNFNVAMMLPAQAYSKCLPTHEAITKWFKVGPGRTRLYGRFFFFIFLMYVVLLFICIVYCQTVDKNRSAWRHFEMSHLLLIIHNHSWQLMALTDTRILICHYLLQPNCYETNRTVFTSSTILPILYTLHIMWQTRNDRMHVINRPISVPQDFTRLKPCTPCSDLKKKKPH